MAKVQYDDLLERHTKDAARRIYNAETMRDMMVDAFKPKSVADVGCGVGYLSKAFIEKGIEVHGVDGDWVENVDLAIPKENLTMSDLNEPLKMSKKYDMAICLEVAEHLNPERSDSLIDDLTEISDVVVFSAAIPNQGGFGHINERWQDEWCALFQNKGYECYNMFRSQMAKDGQIFPWFHQNLYAFVRTGIKLPKKVTDTKITLEEARYVSPHFHEKILRRMRQQMRKQRRKSKAG